MFSSPTDPLPRAYREVLVGNMREGLRAIAVDANPTEDHWRYCSDAVNLLAVIIADGMAQDAGGLLKDAENALAECALRFRQGKSMRLSGPGLAAVKAMLDDFEACVDGLSARYMRDVSNRADKIIWEAQHGRPRAGAEVVAL